MKLQVETVAKIAFFLLIACLFIIEHISREYPFEGLVSRAIAQKILSRDGAYLPVAMFTPFKWSEMYVFKPDEPRETICAELGLSGLRCWWLTPSKVEWGRFFLVFTGANGIVHTEHLKTSSSGYLVGFPRRVSSVWAGFRVFIGSSVTGLIYSEEIDSTESTDREQANATNSH